MRPMTGMTTYLKLPSPDPHTTSISYKPYSKTTKARTLRSAISQSTCSTSNLRALNCYARQYDIQQMSSFSWMKYWQTWWNETTRVTEYLESRWERTPLHSKYGYFIILFFAHISYVHIMNHYNQLCDYNGSIPIDSGCIIISVYVIDCTEIVYEYCCRDSPL